MVRGVGGTVTGRAQLLPGAEVGTIGDGLRIVERQQHLRQKTLVIHIFAGLGQPLRRPLLRAGKEIVHVEHAAPQLTRQPRCQCAFAGAAPPVDGDNEPPFLLKLLLNGLHQPGIVTVSHMVSFLTGARCRLFRGAPVDSPVFQMVKGIGGGGGDVLHRVVGQQH